LVLISDTVGFIQGLPHDLIYAFRSTLEESLDADVLIHVVDISSPIWAEQVQTVEQVLKDLGAGEVPTIYAFNKCDKVRDVNVAEIAAEYRGIPISALYGYGLEDLFMRIEKELLSKTKIVSWKIPYVMWDVLSEIREYGTILEEVYDTNGAQVTCRLAPADISRLSKKLSG
jgi:GTP-binding protein HflX